MEQRCYGIYYNASAGQGQSVQYAKQVEQRLQRHDIKVKLMTASNTDEAITMVANQLSSLDALVVVGGDGTLNVAVTAMVQRHLTVSMGLIPSGRVNNFAKQWQIPINFDEAMQLIFDQHLQRIGIGKCDGKRAIMSYMGFGNLADLASDARQRAQTTGMFSRMVHFVTALRRSGLHHSYEVDYQLDNHEWHTMKTWVALVATNPPSGTQYWDIQPQRFYLGVLNNIHRRQVMPYVYFAWSGKLHQSGELTYMTPKTLKLRPTHKMQTIVTMIVGDRGPSLPLVVEFCPKVLPIFLPLTQGDQKSAEGYE